MTTQSRSALLVVNLGTPDAPDVPSVRRYLHEFLHDPFVIDIPAVARWALVNLIILPFRPKKSAAAYRSIWTARGSPLAFHSRDLLQKLRHRLVPKDFVAAELGMRYGRPSLRAALESLRKTNPERLVVAPLYPQYALSSTETALVKIREELAAMNWDVPWVSLPPFYEDPGFINALGSNIRASLANARFDHVMLSFHGLPERHVKKTDPTAAYCLAGESAGGANYGRCCDVITEANRNCYRAQSLATARKLREVTGWPAERTTISFQSRLGRTPWIQPFTDVELAAFPKRGIKRLLVACPSFVSDCLETLEEIQMRGRETFIAAGGEELVYVPAVNAQDNWADALARMLTKI